MLVLFAVNVRAADEPRDGNWWNVQTPIHRTTYVLGLIDGADLGMTFAVPTAKLNSAGQATPEFAAEMRAFFARYNAAEDKYFKSVEVGQVVDGVDEFFKDFRNRSIRVVGAVHVVLKQIAGEDTETLVRFLRQSK
jgi:hypothetical protein